MLLCAFHVVILRSTAGRAFVPLRHIMVKVQCKADNNTPDSILSGLGPVSRVRVPGPLESISPSLTTYPAVEVKTNKDS